MKSEEITKLIEEEIKGNWPQPNPHDVDLKKSLVVPPVKQVFKDSFNDNKEIDMWLVLEEDPDEKNGYKIVFDEKEKQFGLATSNGVFIGFYGTFLATLNGM
jgi:hypothetical protein